MSRERMPDGSTVERDERGAIVAVYVDDDTWAGWEAERRQAVRTPRSARPAALKTVASRLLELGLRPIVDAELDVVRCDCPDCHADRGDPLGLYRPLAVIPRKGRTLFRCDACDREEVQR